MQTRFLKNIKRALLRFIIEKRIWYLQIGALFTFIVSPDIKHANTVDNKGFRSKKLPI